MKLTLVVRLPLPEDRTKRLFVIAVICSILFHVALLAALFFVDTRTLAVQAKRGEPLLVDITPDKPEDRAPLGNPARPPGPREPEPAAKAPPAPAPPPAPPKGAPAPPPPKAAPAPKSVAPRPAPEPPRRVAAAPPPPVPKAPPPPETPAPSPPPPAPREADATREPERVPTPSPQPAPAAQAPGVPAAPSGAQTALARPPQPQAPSIFRGGGGGLRGGRGGSAGEPIPLDTPDPDYREYMEKVKQRIYAKWGYPYEAQTRGLQGRLIIEFHIAKDGHLQYIELRQTSGEEILDSFALTAVKLAQVYPPLPDAMKRDVLPVLAVFVYTMRGPLSVLQSLQ